MRIHSLALSFIIDLSRNLFAIFFILFSLGSISSHSISSRFHFTPHENSSNFSRSEWRKIENFMLRRLACLSCDDNRESECVCVLGRMEDIRNGNLISHIFFLRLPSTQIQYIISLHPYRLVKTAKGEVDLVSLVIRWERWKSFRENIKF